MIDNAIIKANNLIMNSQCSWPEDLRFDILDIAAKLSSEDYASKVNKENTEELSNILSYTTNNIEFYSPFKGSVNLQDFPIVDKTFLNSHRSKMIAPGFSEENTHIMYTSGSTGIPFMVFQDMEKRRRHIADLKFFGYAAGYEDGSGMCYLRAKPTARKKDMERDRIYQLDITNLSRANLSKYYDVMVEKGCVALIAYPSTLERAVDYWSTLGKNRSKIKTIISTSETLEEDVKEKLRSFFGPDVGIYARYSNTENGILGQETGCTGSFLLNWASYYFELVSLDGDERVKDGELGRIVITDLYNKAFPLIRYDTGDVAVFNRSAGSFPTIENHYGRKMDLIFDTSGEVVSPFLLCRTMRLSKGVMQWQFIQKGEREYLLKINGGSEKPKLEKEINDYKETLGRDALIKIEYVDEIPVLNSLKRRLIISELKK